MGKILSQMNRLDTPLSVDSLAMEFQARLGPQRSKINTAKRSLEGGRDRSHCERDRPPLGGASAANLTCSHRDVNDPAQ
jgi:hypothetical protein